MFISFSAHIYALFTRHILAHNIAIKRYCDKIYYFSSKYCSYISKSFQISRKKNIFNSHDEKKYWLKNVFLSFYRNIAILCVKMSNFNFVEYEDTIYLRIDVQISGNIFAEDESHDSRSEKKQHNLYYTSKFMNKNPQSLIIFILSKKQNIL